MTVVDLHRWTLTLPLAPPPVATLGRRRVRSATERLQAAALALRCHAAGTSPESRAEVTRARAVLRATLPPDAPGWAWAVASGAGAA